MANDTNLKHLHPTLRVKVQSILLKLTQQSVPLKLLETYRTPAQQKALVAQGSTVQPWHSYFQYGLICDFGVFVDGNWSNEVNEAVKAYWQKLHAFAAQEGLEIGGKMSTVQLPLLSIEKLMNGQYPPGGDESWVKNVGDNIITWTEEPKPPLPVIDLAGTAGPGRGDERDQKSMDAVPPSRPSHE